jgi:peptidyl-tRNA hydrolase
MEAKLFILIRDDIPLADQGVQAGHAVAEYCKNWIEQKNRIESWKNGTLVYLTVKDKRALYYWQEKLTFKGIKFSTFIEPDINDEATAIACFTDTKIFGKLKKWLE